MTNKHTGSEFLDNPKTLGTLLKNILIIDSSFE